jgi:hypothetical protein
MVTPDISELMSIVTLTLYPENNVFGTENILSPALRHFLCGIFPGCNLVVYLRSQSRELKLMVPLSSQ